MSTKTQTAVTIEYAIKNGNSTINQRIKGEFISKHVYANVNSMVEYILSKGFEDREAPFNFDDITNYYTYPEYYGQFAKFKGGTYEQRQEEIERLESMLNDSEMSENHLEGITEEQTEKIQAEIEELQNLESEPSEIYEWWMVSEFLCTKLQEQGYCTIDSEGIWGRCTTGQAILLDGVITRICAEMEILEGQENSWA